MSRFRGIRKRKEGGRNQLHCRTRFRRITVELLLVPHQMNHSKRASSVIDGASSAQDKTFAGFCSTPDTIILPNRVRHSVFLVETHSPGILSFSRVTAPTPCIIIGPCNFGFSTVLVHPSLLTLPTLCPWSVSIPRLGILFSRQAYLMSILCLFLACGPFFLWFLF